MQKIPTNYPIIKLLQTISQTEQIMNTKFLSALTATAAATALFSTAAPAQAASFGTSSIKFDTDTAVDFTFLETHSMYISSFGVYNVKNSVPTLIQDLFAETKRSDNNRQDEWKGTLGNTVLGPATVRFLFLGGEEYAFGVNSGNDGSVYSTTGLNSRGTQQAVFGDLSLFNALDADTTRSFRAAGQHTNALSALFNGGAVIALDDGGNGMDRDFQDFVVTAEAVPEPMTMTGLALGLGGLVAARRRRGSKTVS